MNATELELELLHEQQRHERTRVRSLEMVVRLTERIIELQDDSRRWQRRVKELERRLDAVRASVDGRADRSYT